MTRDDAETTPRDRDRRQLRAMGLTTRAVNVLAQAGVRTGADLLAPDLSRRLSRIDYCPGRVLQEIAYVGELLASDPLWRVGDGARMAGRRRSS